MSILSWNCRGAGNPATVKEVHDLTRRFAPSILYILETQIEGTRVENLVDTLGFNKSYVVSSFGRSRGLGIFWNGEIKLEVVGYSKYHIDTLIDELVETPVRVTFFYGEA